MIELMGSNGFLITLDGVYPVLKLTPKAVSLEMGEERFRMKKLKEKKVLAAEKAAKSRKEKAEKKALVFKNDRQANVYLLERLRELRRELADKQHVPVYLIFQDSVLVEIAMMRPRTLEEFSRIKGVGASKLARYGATFVQFVRDMDGQG